MKQYDSKINIFEVADFWYASKHKTLELKSILNDDWIYNQHWVEYTTLSNFTEMVLERLNTLDRDSAPEYIKWVIRVAFHARDTIHTTV